MPQVDPKPETLYRWQDAVTEVKYATHEHLPPDIDPPGGWAVPPASVEGLNVVWKQYAAPSALIVRWQRLIYWVGLPEEDGTEFCVCGCPSGIVLESKPPKCSDCGQLTPVEDIEAERGR